MHYLISGLGADYRAFAKLDLGNVPDRLTHLHGTTDRILPIRYVANAIPIEGGGHLMTLTQVEAVSAEIRSIAGG
jgi:pimeloyl-ACP methyl ester carboxylesterase